MKRHSIIFGLLIDNEVGREWIKKTYNYDPCADHTEDLTIIMQLRKLVMEKGIALGCCAAPRRLEALVSDALSLLLPGSSPRLEM